MVGAYSLSDPVQLIQINFWSGTETAGEFVPMLVERQCRAHFERHPAVVISA